MNRQNSPVLLAVLIAFVLTIGLAEGVEVDGQEPRYGLKIRTGRVAASLAALPAFALSEDVLHEGSHALWIAVQGGRVTAFKPYPHVEEREGARRFVFGSMAGEGHFSDRQNALVFAGPSLTDLALFTASDLLLTYGVDADAWYAPIIFMAGMLLPAIDWITTMNAWNDSTDIVRFCRLTGTDRIALTVAGDALAVAAVWRLLHHGRNIFFTKEPAVGAPILAVSPMVGRSSVGVAFAGTF